MANMAMKLRLLPWRKGLATGGQQSSIPEDALWQAQDVQAGLDGLMTKRPGLKQWGQTLKAPSSDATTTWMDGFIDTALPGWIQTTNAKVSNSASQGQLVTNVLTGTGNETATISRIGTASSNDASLRFVLQAVNVGAYDGSATNANTFHFRIGIDASNGKEFAVWSGGLYYKAASDSQYDLVADTESVGTGQWSVIEIRLDEDGNTLVYLDETLVDTITTSALETVSLTSSSSAEFAWEVSGSGGEQYSTRIVTAMFADTVTDPFDAVVASSLSNFRALVGSGTLQRTLLCAAGDYVYHDSGLLQVWRPIARKNYPNVRFTPFRKQICWIESDGITQSKVWLWTGESTSNPDEQEEAPNCQFGTEHQQRLWVAGDRANPLRAYYSGDRQPNVWFAPSQNNISDRFDTQLNAGYIEIPSKSGDEITAIFGDYYGTVVIFTRQGVFKVTGFGTSSYQVTAISQDVGCENTDCVAQVGNDLWFLSREGVHSLQQTEKFGDLQKTFASAAIQDLWGGDASAVKAINKTYIDESKLKYNPTLGLVYVAVPLNTDLTAQKIYTFNTNNSEWYGPWNIDSQGMELVELASPVIEAMMHCGSNGKVLYTDQLYKSDDGTAITSVIETAFLNGRSLDPAMVGHMKTWKRVRVYLLPRGNWKLKCFWRADSGFYADADTSDKDQNRTMMVYPEVRALTEEFKLGSDPDGRLHSREKMGYFEFRPDVRGYSLSLKFQQDGNGEDFAIQGIEVDFIDHDHESEA